MPAPALVLASGSVYRRLQLQRIGLDCLAKPADIDESQRPDEAPAAMALRLARSKARAVSECCPGAIVIGADQVAACHERILGKPGSATAQAHQLQSFSAQEVRFYTAISVIDHHNHEHSHVDLTRCQVRQISPEEIARYVEREPAHDCAGGFKVEGLGITLFERIQCEDPSALIGLPLLALCRILRHIGVTLV